MAFLPKSDAAVIYWAGTDNAVATAGEGTWDSNTSLVWRDSTPTGTLVKWTDNATAIFEGSAGGAVSMADVLVADELRFSIGAGAFVFEGSPLLEIAGAGISNDSASDQTFHFNQTNVTFSGHASAGDGAHGDRVFITADGLTTFTGDATAGQANLTTSGETQFSDTSSAGSATLTVLAAGQITFQGSASAGTATILNQGVLFFSEQSSSGAAAITNQGLLLIDGSAHSFATTSFSNLGGTIDLSGATFSGGVSIGSLTNGIASTLAVGTTHLTIGSLNLVDGNELSFGIGTGVAGQVTVTTSILGNTTAEGTRVTINDNGGLANGQSYILLDWSTATSVLGVDPGDFKLLTLPAGFAGDLHVAGNQLVLEVLPEPGTAALLVFGVGALLARRGRRLD